MYFANFALSAIQYAAADLQGPITTVATVPGIGAPGDEPDEDVTLYTVSRIKLPNQ